MFRIVVAAAAAGLVLLFVAFVVFLLSRSWPAIRHYGFSSFVAHSRWAPSEATRGARKPNPYGLAQFLYGTVLTSAIGLVIALPIAIGVAVFLNDVASERLRRPLQSLTEVLAMVPSVVYGFWGAFALVPVLRPVIDLVTRTLGPLPVIGVPFRGPFFGFSYFTAGIVLAIMILPIITALAREVVATV